MMGTKVNLLVCVLLLLLNLLCSGFGELTGVDNTTSNVQHESATPSIDEINIFPFDSGVSGNEKVDYPVVNKCCPFLTRYENGVCIKLHNNSDASSGEEDEFRPSGPIITLTKDSEGLNMTDIYGEPVNFRLQVSQPQCAMSDVRTIFLSQAMPISEKTDANTSVALSRFGYLVVSDSLGYDHQIPHQQFCLDQVNTSTNIAVICNPQCDGRRPCVRKCCGRDEVLHNDTCINSTKRWNPYLYNSQGKRVQVDPANDPYFKIGPPKNCETYSIHLQDVPLENFYLLMNGSLMLVDMKGAKSIVDMDSFCIDGSGSTTEVFTQYVEGEDYPDVFEFAHYSGNERDQTAVICYPENGHKEVPEEWRLMLFGCIALMSSFFLFLTALVYLILWEYQNIHGWLQFCYVISLLVAFTFLAFVQLSPTSIQEVSRFACELIGSLIHFLFLSAFFWLTSMNFDLWWTFSGCRPLRTNNTTGEKKRFLCFGLFSWGFPSLIAGTGLVLDALFRDNPYIITPRFGDRYCYFFGDKEKLPYFYGPVGFLLTINSIFFISTIYSLYKLQNDTKFATRQSSKQEKKRFLLFMKLFVVMGVLWIFEAMSWATALLNPQQSHLINNFFLPTDILNTAQGIAIFVIFTCKPNTCRQLDAQFKKFSVFLEEKRVRDSNANPAPPLIRIKFLTAVCTVIIPIINRLRDLMSFCGRVTRSLEGRRHMSHTNTITSTTWDKSRKASDCSASTVISHLEPGSIELDLAVNPQSFYIRSNSVNL